MVRTYEPTVVPVTKVLLQIMKSKPSSQAKNQSFKINRSSSSCAHFSNFISLFFVEIHDTKFQNDFTQYYLLQIKLFSYDTVRSYTL
jgi:hypothetical protein